MTGLKQQLIDRVDSDLKEIETALHNSLTPHLELVRQTAGHLLFSGGKRIRPLLNMLCARMCGYTDEFIKRFSTIIEFLHTATLLHDDVVDGASMRRGKPTAHKIFGTPVTVLVGDFLLARALSIAAETQSPRIIAVISEITESMCQGEITQLIQKGDLNITESQCMDVISRKTGFLIQGACQTGALIANAAPEVERRLADFGFHIGIAFQIADDLLDYTSNTKALGKTIGADLKEGKLTLPVIFTLDKADDTDRQWMEQLIKNMNFSDQEFERLVSLLQYHGGIDYSRGVASHHIDRAKKILESFEMSPTRETLMMIADYTLGRKS